MSKNQSPFKFLDAYGIDDRKIFFGRDWEIDELYDRLQESNLVLLYGASGTGKTSLIKCGLYNLYNSTDWLPIWITKASED
ncbi:MAG: ATP-binding protein, partial [Bacteroidota bacterium]